ncbi:chromo domain-like protein [Ascodesmis nigricans]|uniref:Chromo domain-like protein n=1 Tax=Ascodesmis nigricans TaxID=341454 RepID=A0A4S2MS29_9PEZI|nr:chromo domain-like protein [Ascodesmis nigricans]
MPRSATKKAASTTPATSRRSKKQEEPEPSPEPEPAEDDKADDEGDEDEDAGEEEEYVVEKIMDHKIEKKKLYFHVKWKGYEKKSDMTWEPEENCAGAQEAVEDYFAEIGGRPQPVTPAKSSNKRNRISTVGASSDNTPAPKSVNKRARKSIAGGGDDMDIDDKKWTPPNTKSWEEDVIAIDTIEKNNDGQLVCFVQWKDGKKSQHPIQDIYKKCPQRMLKFYEQHLVFKETGAMQ